MADCSKTDVFLTELKRMCDSIVCSECEYGRSTEPCRALIMDNYEEALRIVQKWSDEHPAPKQKTYADVFRGKFPNQHIDHTNPKWWRRICRLDLFGGVCKHGDCEKCWKEPYKEDE